MASDLWDDIHSSNITVKPQFVSDKSYVESAVDFFHDVVPQAVGSVENRETEKILWVKFEEADLNDRLIYDEIRTSDESRVNLPMLLCIAYQNGFHIWTIKPNNEALELLSVKKGSVRSAKLLKSPALELLVKDKFINKRPLIAICDEDSVRTPYTAVAIYSLKTGERVSTILHDSEIYNIVANDRLLVVCLADKIITYEATDFERSFTITGCYSCDTICSIPVSLSGSRWLAYADRGLFRKYQSFGGVVGGDSNSYTTTVLNAAKVIGQGLSKISETVSRFTSSKTVTETHNSKGSSSQNLLDDYCIPGMVTVIDIKSLQLSQNEFDISKNSNGKSIIAHFQAHVNEAIEYLTFDPSGLLLLTAAELGQKIHVFRIAPHTLSSSLCSVHHLYTLYRGDTLATVKDISFSYDSRWISVSTAHGTTHIFPISPNGGIINWRTHGHLRVVDRNSRFHTSAGLEDILPISHLPKPVPESDFHFEEDESLKGINKPLCICSNRLLMVSLPIVVLAHARIKQLLFPSIMESISGSPKVHFASSRNNSPSGSLDCVASQFSYPRHKWINSYKMNEAQQETMSLYVVHDQGKLVEYTLEVRPKNVTQASDETVIELIAQPRIEWHLKSPSKGFGLPLHASNPLLLASEKSLKLSSDHATFNVLKSSRISYSAENKVMDGEWLSEVEITTHSSPHRRLWMGPQFRYKTYTYDSSDKTNGSKNNAATIVPDGLSYPFQPAYLDECNLKHIRLTPIARSKPLPTPTNRNRSTIHRSSFSSSAGSCDSTSSGSGQHILIDNGPNSYELGLKPAEGYTTSSITFGSPNVTTENVQEFIQYNIANAMEDVIINGNPSTNLDQVIVSPEDIRDSPPTTLISSSYTGSMDHVAVFPATHDYE
ncbi:uncharacterized protein TRIADDRAFT_59756 [Trichoplax adhaerens]|uniref:BCAS3 WD40 domain-containing protein n=1 Tax=Trichoplax adhaerens TaxID=10228 RepID=B3S6C4_TRIAD|nr:hypothetical protein TRIADDRAFT_59756 [Trichoplax adhaerens]EDV21732.1 hypothetical protein TRIADDRAFT_59756 [Trichoplax adhaerens]|eukprot:XP_002115880.1 hypothetical protein TRIADDRAFT_59756 [Trichoplax adhaerens]